MPLQRRELVQATPIFSGPGLHLGQDARVRVAPGRHGAGIVFRRRDRPGEEMVPARLEAAVPARRRLLLERDGVRVSTPEHLLAALYGLGIEAAEVELWGEEVPLLDGSAAPFAEALWAGSRPVADGEAPRRLYVLTRAFARQVAGAACRLVPDEALRLRAVLDFGPWAPQLRQRLAWEADHPWSFRRRLAPARSFGFFDEAGELRAKGLARGARLGNLLVFGARAPLNPSGTRFRDEPVRHKLLDALGALALLGAPLRGKLILDRCGHALLVATLRDALVEGALRRT